METRTVVEAEGAAQGGGSTALMTLCFLGIVGALAVLIVRLVVPLSPERVWGSLAVLVGSVGLLVWQAKRDAVRVRIHSGEGGLRVVVQGRTTKIDEALHPGLQHWISFQRQSLKHGGQTLFHYNVLLTTQSGERIGFTEVGGTAGGEPQDWPTAEVGLGMSGGTFLVYGLKGWPPLLRAA